MLFYSTSSIIFSTPYFDKARITIYLTNHRNPNTAACSVGSVSSFLAGNDGGTQWHHIKHQMFYKIRELLGNVLLRRYLIRYLIR